MVKVGFSLQAIRPGQSAQIIALLHNVGASAVSPAWSQDLPLGELADCAAKHNMVIQSLHAPRKGIPTLWEPKNPASAHTMKSITDCMDACAEFEIPVTVVHGWQGLDYRFPEAPLDFANFDYLVAYAGQKKVSIAFENLEGEEYLEALMARYGDQSHIGFCWDSGHDHCYPHKLDFLKAFGGKLIMTHLNDNLGLRDPLGIPKAEDDLHFLPYDGNIHWESALGRLKDLPKQGILNFELKKRSKSASPEDLIYEHMTLEEYFAMAGQRALRIAMLYEKIMDCAKVTL